MTDENRVVVSFKEHSVFQDGGDTLKNIIKDMVTPEIQESLLNAE